MTREEALDYLKRIKENYNWCCEEDALEMAIKALEQESKQGHWINLYSDHYKCSECGAWWQGEEITECNYCPNCGAKMEG